MTYDQHISNATTHARFFGSGGRLHFHFSYFGPMRGWMRKERDWFKALDSERKFFCLFAVAFVALMTWAALV